MEKVDYSKGALLRKGDAKDFSFCSPDKYEKRKCAVMTLDAFQNLLEDYVDMQERLKACEKANR
jgi:NifU-like protein involved in Fe-S cluster formation